MARNLRRTAVALLVGMVCALTGALLGIVDLGATFERNVGLSWLFKLRGAIAPPSDVVVVAIDSTTGGHLGLPSLPREWSRSVHARLVDELVRRGASVIVFDVQFDKPKIPRDDAAFSRAVDAADRVVLIELVTGRRRPVTDANGIQSGSVWLEEQIRPIPALVKGAKGLGTFPLPKIDATVHEFWAFKESVGDAPTLPAVALQLHALSVYTPWIGLLQSQDIVDRHVLPTDASVIGKAAQVRELMATLRTALENDPAGAERLAHAITRASPQRSAEERTLLQAMFGLYTGDAHRMLNFYGPPGTIPTVPFHAVIHAAQGKAGASVPDLRGKAVFVGFSDLYDPGQPDRFYTVFSGEDGVDLSGVEIAATAFANLLADRSIRPAGALPALALILVFGFALGVSAYLFPAMVGVPLTFALAGGYAATAQWMFNAEQHWLPLAIPLTVQFPLALFLGLLGQYVVERRRGKLMNKALGYYLPENVARALTENRGDAGAFNRVVYGTCLATDMSGFSTIAEQLPPDQLAKFLNAYFDTLAQPLKRHHVDVTEFRADAIMCAWTAEQVVARVREKAVLAALDAAAAIEAFKERESMHKASLRIGLECGHFYIGHAGGGGHFVFSIVGDTANTASRIESLNKHLGTSILATRAVVEGLEGLLLRPLGAFVFVGKSEAIPIVEIVASERSATHGQRRLVTQFSQALAVYHAAQWAEAAAAFEGLLRDFPGDGPARFYLARCRSLLAGAPPPDDPRVVRMDIK